jgi:hypothetical protein
LTLLLLNRKRLLHRQVVARVLSPDEGGLHALKRRAEWLLFAHSGHRWQLAARIAPDPQAVISRHDVWVSACWRTTDSSQQHGGDRQANAQRGRLWRVTQQAKHR